MSRSSCAKPVQFAMLLASLWILSPADARSDPVESGNIISDYSLTAWGEKDGLPPGVIWALAQDAAGYLWLGTDTGPVVFDGVHFAPWRTSTADSLPRAGVRVVSVAQDGSIWLGFDKPGGVSHIHDGIVRNFGTSEGLPSAAVTALLPDPDGTIWVGSQDGLFRLRNDSWAWAGDGLPKAVIYELHIDRASRFFAATAAGIFLRNPGEKSFRPVGSTGYPVRSIAESRSGTIWAADAITGFRELHGDHTWRSVPGTGNGSRLLYDSNGSLWVGTFGQGIWRFADPASGARSVQRTTTLTGLSADGVMALLEDRDANVWVATNDGLNRFTPHRVTPILNLGVIAGVQASPDGNVWVGSAGALLRFADGRVKPEREPLHLDRPPSAMHVGPDGSLWIATSRELHRFVEHRWRTMPLPRVGDDALSEITEITSGADGELWLYDRVQGLFRWNQGLLKATDLPPALRRLQVTSMLTDAKGVLWLSLADGRVASLRGAGDTRVYARPEDRDSDGYRAMFADDSGLWLGGAAGVTRLVDGRFQAFDRTNGFPAGTVISILEDDEHALWFALLGSGVARAKKLDLEQAFRDPSYQIHFTFFDKSDGFAGSPRWFGNSTAARGTDGRLWFLSMRGISIVDPHSLRETGAVAGSVRLDKIVVDGQESTAVSGTMSLARGHRLEIQYSVPTLTYPMRTQFRYRLVGFDSDWIDARTERRAVYTNLPPRQYRFRVVARHDGGIWPDAKPVLELSILPRFYETLWFRTSAILAVILLAGIAWRLYLQNVRKQFAILIAERARLSREIHDTVLQGLCGIGLQCDAIAHDPNVTAPAIRERLLRLRDLAEEYARETRLSILDLRSPDLGRCDLAEELRRSAKRALDGNNVRFELTVSGVPFDSSPSENEHLVRIAQEAVANSIRHGRATEIRMGLLYGDSALLLKLSDNGAGFEPETVQNIDGHCGLANMRERALAAGGTLTIESHPGRGTDIEAMLPKHRVI